MSLIWTVAGESSGDARAEELMHAIRAADPEVRFVGAGGPRMKVLAGEPFDDWIADAAVVGLWDVLRHYGYFRRKFHGMIEAIGALRPDAVLLVDYPGFNLRLAKALRRAGYTGKILYYISPQVWAWNRGRIPKMARLLDLMICVFPFEKPMYEASGLKTVFAGHPLLEALLREKDPSALRDRNMLALLPGSRRREVQRIFPLQLAAAKIVAQRRPQTRFVVAVASDAHADLVRQLAGNFPLEVRTSGARELMRTAGAGIVCSGTATLEAAFFGLPYCLVYKAAWLTFQIGMRVVDVNCLGIVNILNNYRVHPPEDPGLPARPAPHIVKEFIQHFAKPEALATEALLLLDDESERAKLAAGFESVLAMLRAGGASERAALAILEEVRK